jgi:predicted 2-oxoglutarate/Fe(II)-dependent dioxygenase YbiX
LKDKVVKGKNRYFLFLAAAFGCSVEENTIASYEKNKNFNTSWDRVQSLSHQQELQEPISSPPPQAHNHRQ